MFNTPLNTFKFPVIMFRNFQFNSFQVIFKRYYSTALLRYGYCNIPLNIFRTETGLLQEAEMRRAGNVPRYLKNPLSFLNFLD